MEPARKTRMRALISGPAQSILEECCKCVINFFIHEEIAMVAVEPTGEVLGATVRGLDLSRPLPEREFGAILWALGRYGVLCFPGQALDAAALKAFSARFGELEVNVAAGAFCDPAHPEVMIL